MTIKNAKMIQQKSRTHRVDQVGPQAYNVTSGASGSTYRVTVANHGATCTCDWGKYRPRGDGRSG